MSLDPGGRSANDLRACPAVLAFVGEEMLGRLRGEAYRSYNCCSCGRPGRADAEPTTVIVQRYRHGTNRVRFAHARCADSQVIEVGAATVDPAVFEGLLSRTAVLNYASAQAIRPLLILEPRTMLYGQETGGQRVNALLSGLLDRGFTLMRTSDQLPRPAGGWLLHLAQLLAPDGTVAYEGRIDPLPSWVSLVRTDNACVVLTGTIGLGIYSGYEMTTADLRRLLNQAAQFGELAGALVSTQDTSASSA